MAGLRLPAGLSHRPARWSDAHDVAGLLIACEEYGDIVEVELSDVTAEWQRPGVDLATMTVIVFDGRHPVGFAMVFDGRAEVAVAPSHRGRGIGSVLVAFVADVARRHGGVVVEQVIPDERAAAVALVTAHGYAPVRTSWSLQIEVGDAPRPVAPAPYRVADLTDADLARPTYDVIERAFSEWPGRRDTPFGDWDAQVWRHASLDRAGSAVVTHDDRVVGVAICFDYDVELWVHQLAVAAEHRGRGLGRLLLGEVFWRAGRGGHTTVGLSTDSRTGALTLYEHVGMHVRRTYTRWSKALDAA